MQLLVAKKPRGLNSSLYFVFRSECQMMMQDRKHWWMGLSPGSELLWCCDSVLFSWPWGNISWWQLRIWSLVEAELIQPFSREQSALFCVRKWRKIWDADREVNEISCVENRKINWCFLMGRNMCCFMYKRGVTFPHKPQCVFNQSFDRH